MTIEKIAVIGFGEVGQMLAQDLRANNDVDVAVWDVGFADPDSNALALARQQPIRIASDAHDAVADAELVVSAVTAAQTLSAAASVSGGIAPGSIFLDMNSAAPQTKIAAATMIEDMEGCYIEAAVMSPVGKTRLATPILLGGPDASRFLPQAQALGFAGAEAYSAERGRAAAAKLCRSIIVKGTEAIVLEALVAARHFELEDTVLASLKDLFPEKDWETFAAYLIGRAVEHGERRAEELEEAARMVEGAGLEPILSSAIARRQRWAAGFPQALQQDKLAASLDILLSANAKEAP